MAIPPTFSAKAIILQGESVHPAMIKIWQRTSRDPHEPFLLQGTFSVLSGIVQKEGVAGIFRGIGPTIMTNAPFSALYYMFYSDLKRRLQPVSIFTLYTAQLLRQSDFLVSLCCILTASSMERGCFLPCGKQHSTGSSTGSAPVNSWAWKQNGSLV